MNNKTQHIKKQFLETFEMVLNDDWDNTKKILGIAEETEKQNKQ